MSHSVRAHLRVDIDAYDRTIRTFLPAYDEMIAFAANTVAAAMPGSVLDLGAGTGALALAILERCETCEVELLDVDPEMLARARERLAPHASRTRLSERTFQGPLPACDAVAASLALHHVSTLDEKRALYGAIHAALSPGGVFVNADVTIAAEPPGRDAEYRRWAAHLVSCGIAEERAWRHFEEWAGEDTYFPLADELAALADAGFSASAPWRTAPSTVMVGVKAADPRR